MRPREVSVSKDVSKEGAWRGKSDGGSELCSACNGGGLRLRRCGVQRPAQVDHRAPVGHGAPAARLYWGQGRVQWLIHGVQHDCRQWRCVAAVLGTGEEGEQGSENDE
jgi:hypothetical protein